MKKNLLIIGAGQYGMVVKELATKLDCYDKIDFLDDEKEVAIAKIDEYKNFKEEYACAIPAIGDADLRIQWVEKLKKVGFCVPILISPMAYVSPSAQIDEGTVIEPLAVVHAQTTIGKACIISAHATINHNSVCGDACHIDCGAVIGSNCTIPKGSKVKYGVVVERNK